jgi:hypothetical protein
VFLVVASVVRMSTQSIKLALAGTSEVVRLPFHNPVDLEVIKSVVSLQWRLGPSSFDLEYLDDTSEIISLTSNEGLSEALQHHAGPMLKVTITRKASTAEGEWACWTNGVIPVYQGISPATAGAHPRDKSAATGITNEAIKSASGDGISDEGSV